MNHEPTKERRRFPRYTVALKLHYQHVAAESGKKAPAHLQESVTKDVGAGGLAMLGAQRLEPGQTLMLTLFLPLTGQPEAQAFALGRVVWHQLLSSQLYLHGLQFVDLADEDRKKLHEFIKTRQPVGSS